MPAVGSSRATKEVVLYFSEIVRVCLTLGKITVGQGVFFSLQNMDSVFDINLGKRNSNVIAWSSGVFEFPN